MEINALFTLLNEQPDPIAQRGALIAYLKNQATKIQDTHNKAPVIAYTIAGIMATDYARSLPADDPIEEILTIAGELEINPTNTDKLREALLQKIEKL